MGDYDFVIEGLYEGYWKLPMLDNDTFGTLSIENRRITLRIIFKGNNLSICNNICYIEGKAFNKKKNRFYFSLYNLKIVRCEGFDDSYNEYIFEVGDVCMKMKPDVDFNAINHCVIRTGLLDEWVWEYINDSYFYDLTLQKDNNQNIEYKQKDPYLFFKNDEYDVCLYFGTRINYPSACGFHIINKCFLNVHFNNKQNFTFVHAVAEKISHFFSLLWNAAYIPEYIEYRTNDNKFVYVRNSNRIIDKERRTVSCVYTELSDFSKEEISIMFEKWMDLYDKYSDALSMYFNSLSNTNLSNDLNIKNIVSVIDGITERVEINGMSDNTRRKEELNGILCKCTELSDEEKNKLKTWVLREKGTELKPRFKKMLSQIEYLLPDEYITKVFSIDNDGWVNRIIDIRNSLTHPKGNNAVISFSPIEYSKYSSCLKKILHTYLMYKISTPDKVIKKVSDFL